MHRSATIASYSLQGSWLACAAAVALLTAGLLGWTASARRAYSAPRSVLFARSPWPLVLPAVVMTGCALVAALVRVPPDDGALIFLPAFFAAIFYLAGLVSTLTFFVADDAGLTWQVLSIKRTLPWYAIDWIYPEQRVTTYSSYGIQVGRTREQALVVEAGPQQRIRVPLRVPMMRTSPDALVHAIRQRAKGAAFGSDKRPAVEQRRAAGGALKLR